MGSTGQDVNAALTLRLRGGGTAPNYQKERVIRAVASGQAVTMKLRGGDSSSPEAQHLLFPIAVALVKHTASDVLPCVGAAEDLRPTRMDYRKRRILRAMTSGQAVTRRLYC